MLIFIIIINAALSTLVTSVYYPIIGVFMLVFSVFMQLLGINSVLGNLFVATQMRQWGDKVSDVVYTEKRLLVSVSCLTFSLKVGVAVALFVETSAIIIVAFVILLVFGYFFEGSASGMTIGLGYNIAHMAIKLFSSLSIGFEKIAEWIAKIELHILNIDI